MAFPEAVGDAVGAEEEAVAVFEGVAGEFGVDGGVAAAEGVVEGATAGVSAVLHFADFAALELSPGDVVVVAELLSFAVAVEVESGIADMGEVDEAGGDPGEGESGAHASEVVLFGGEFVDAFVGVAEEIAEGGEVF